MEKSTGNLTLIGLLVLVCSLVWASSANGYSGATHRQITKYVLGGNKDTTKYSFSKVELMYYALKDIGINIVKQQEQEDIAAKIEEGSEEEDNPFWRCKHQFYDPTKPVEEAGLTDGIFPGDPSLLWAQDIKQEWSWKNIREYYFKALTEEDSEDRNKYTDKTFIGLGHIIHLLQDKTVPSHTRNDAHLPELRDWDITGQHDYYEEFCKEEANLAYFAKENFYSDYPVIEFEELKSDPNPEEPVKFSDFWDTDLHFDNFGKGLAEYTNHNFVSRDTNFDVPTDSEIHYYNYPIWTGYHHKPFTFTDKDGAERTVDVLYLKSNATDNYKPDKSGELGYLTTFGYWNLHTDDYGHRPTYVLNDKCHEEYARLLFPRAVGYSAGLLNYFFRGKLDARMEYVPNTSPIQYRLKITNESEEEMTSGTLTLLYENFKGEYIQVHTQVLAEPIPAGEEYSGDLVFTQPTERVVNYIVVFNGTLGNEAPAAGSNEKGAVIGKVLPNPLTVAWKEGDGSIHIYNLTVDTDEDGIPNYLENNRPQPDPADCLIPVRASHPLNIHITDGKLVYDANGGVYFYDLTMDSDGDGIPNYLENPPLSPDPAESLAFATTPGYKGIFDTLANQVFTSYSNETCDAHNMRYNIYRYDLTTGEDQLIATICGKPSAAYGNRIVYTRKVYYPDLFGWPEMVFLRDVTTGQDRIVYELDIDPVPSYTPYQWDPDIYGDKIVYTYNPGDEDASEGGHIDLYDLATSAHRRIGTYSLDGPPPFSEPRIDSNLAVWTVAQAWPEERYLSVYDLVAGAKIPVTESNTTSVPQTAQGVVIWGEEHHPGATEPDNPVNQLYLFDSLYPAKRAIKLIDLTGSEGEISEWTIGY
jgi:hypothetical protein